MSDDLLERASRALRETTEPTSDELEALRASVLANATRAKASRVRLSRWVLPMAAAFVAGTALAATTGQLQRVVHTVEGWISPGVTDSEAATPKAPRAARDASAKAPAPAQPPATEPTASEPSATPAEAVVSAPSVREPARSPRGVERTSRDTSIREVTESHGIAEPTSAQANPTVVEAPPAEPAAPVVPVVNPDLDAYRAAHRVHFGGAAPDAALRAWDGYLASFPEGTFALEARYNRAVCLVKLGRKAEAAEALTPFAEGRMGRGYRRDEARELLHALTSTP